MEPLGRLHQQLPDRDFLSPSSSKQGRLSFTSPGQVSDLEEGYPRRRQCEG